MFLTGALLVAACVYALARYQFRDRLASAEARIKLRDDQLALIGEKVGTDDPDEMKRKLDELVTRVGEISPRTLTVEQRSSILRVASRDSGKLCVIGDTVAFDSNIFARELADAFEKAGWKVETASQLGTYPRGSVGVFLDARQPDSLTADEKTVADALEAAGVSFDLRKAVAVIGGAAMIVVTAKTKP